MITPDKQDPMKIRRLLAFIAVIWALFLTPLWVMVVHVHWGVPVDLLKAAFLYIGGLAGGPLGAYLYAAHKNGNSEKK